MPSHFIAECLDCGNRSAFFPGSPACPNCGSLWREARYDYENLSRGLLTLLRDRPFDIWRYHELLPIRSPNPDLYMGEGGTPLIHANNLGLMLGLPNLYIKDERQGPTSSFKDRQAAIVFNAIKESGIDEFVCASTGNVAISYSAYAARAGIKLWAFLTSLVPEAKMREVAIYGTQVIKVTGSYDQAKSLAEQFAKQRGLLLDLGARSIPCVEGMKTIAFEIAEQLADVLGPELNPKNQTPSFPWRIPDWYFQSISGALGPLGIYKGFQEINQMGFSNKLPKMGLIQVEGCSPMVHAWRQNKDQATPVKSPRTLIATLATGDPGRTYTLLRNKFKNGPGGVFESVTDEEAFRAMHLLAKMEGFSVEPAAAVAFAGLIKLVRSGVVKHDEVVVINCTGHTMSVDSNVIGEGWDHSVDIQDQSIEKNKEEGLLAALNNVSVDKYPRIAIVDDAPDVRRLIRRILQSQGNYILFEAQNGREAIDLIQKERPNLVILDLMMPDIDGFSVIDALQNRKDTKDIPIIVVTAKELTSAEKNRLKGHIQSLMQKGDFLSDDLLDEVRALVK